MCTDADDFAFLKDAQQFYLHVLGQLADFIFYCSTLSTLSIPNSILIRWSSD